MVSSYRSVCSPACRGASKAISLFSDSSSIASRFHSSDGETAGSTYAAEGWSVRLRALLSFQGAQRRGICCLYSGKSRFLTAFGMTSPAGLGRANLRPGRTQLKSPSYLGASESQVEADASGECPGQARARARRSASDHILVVSEGLDRNKEPGIFGQTIFRSRIQNP